MRCRIVLISIVLLLVSAFFVSGLTIEEAKTYIAAHPDQAAQDIVDWDTVQHSTLTFLWPNFAAVVKKDKSVDIIPDNPIGITIAGGLLAYDVKMPPLHYPDLAQCSPGKWDWVQPAFWGCVTGAAVVGVAAVLISVFVHPMPANP
jgi:hypothetical protein